eukprot:CAMPEP_0177789282 /NCGR_PEP_ID=MMETSP0491_2-20121128/22655_1 /TAXON_ID=63592 /ORGANISM="Tetraselmis chuii, Strain PLY429" /LENGTH=274 /DNA_ID=CAMNT_0019311113 /DNA_START=10 /DNA_END=834 /DNA_ORIENTATION=+
MSSPQFLDSAGSQHSAVQISRVVAPTAIGTTCNPPPARSSRTILVDTPDQRRTRLTVTLESSARVAEIKLPDGSVATLPLCPGTTVPARSAISKHRREQLRKTVTTRDVDNSLRAVSYSGLGNSAVISPDSDKGPLQTRATKSMKDLRRLRADAAAGPVESSSRVTLKDKVVLRLSELLSDSLLQTKLPSMGVIVDAEGEEDIEWVTAGELAAKSSLSIISVPGEAISASGGEVDEAAELLNHAKTLRCSIDSRRTLVKAAELFEELLRCGDEE